MGDRETQGRIEREMSVWQNVGKTERDEKERQRGTRERCGFWGKEREKEKEKREKSRAPVFFTIFNFF